MTTHSAPNIKHVKGLKEIDAHFSIILLDMVGVIYDEQSAMPGAIEEVKSILKRNKKLILLTNNPRPNNIAKEKLKKLGFPISLDIFTSGDATRYYLDKHFKNKKIYHLGQHKNKDLLFDRESLIVSSLEDADLVILSIYTEQDENNETYIEELKKIAKSSKPVLCSNPDIKAPYGNTMRKTAGHYAKILEGLGKNVIYMGKPHPFIYDLIWEKYHLTEEDKGKTLMVGDTLETDIVGANLYGLTSLLVLSGNTGKEIPPAVTPISFLMNLDSKLQPSFYSDHL